MALNVTATLLSTFMPTSSGCRAMNNNMGCTSAEVQLLFGNTSGLFAQPVAPKGRIIVIGARGGDDKKPGVEHRGDTIPICNSLIELGWWAQPVFYADTSFELLIHYAEEVDGYISRVNPDVYEDFTVSKFDRLLGHLHQNMGLAAMAHPSMIQRFGAKDALAKSLLCAQDCLILLPITTRTHGVNAFPSA